MTATEKIPPNALSTGRACAFLCFAVYSRYEHPRQFILRSTFPFLDMQHAPSRRDWRLRLVPFTPFLAEKTLQGSRRNLAQ